MMQQKIRLIALDMDGTLLTTDKQITAETKAAVREALAAGIQVTLCTGRTKCETQIARDAIPEIPYMICSSGALVYDCIHEKTLYENNLDYDMVCTIFRALSAFDMQFELFLPDKIYAEQKTLERLEDFQVGRLKPLILKSRTPVPDMKAFLADWQKPVSKVHIFFRSPAQRDAAWKVAAQYPVSIAAAELTDLEINAATSGKGDGLAHLCKILSIPAEQTMGVGDSRNDLSMLAFSGVAVAMANAHEEVKKICPYMTDGNDQDGAAKAIRRFALGEPFDETTAKPR